MTSLLGGFALWTLISLGCLSTAIWLLLDELPSLRRRWAVLTVIVFGYAPVYFGLIDGENATFSLLLYVLIYRALVRDQEERAGFWAAIGLFKPQLFVVFPLVFLARRSWRALGSYVVTALCLAAVSVAIVGMGGVQAWLGVLLEPEAGNASANAWRMLSLKSFFDGVLPGQTFLSLGLYLLADVALLSMLTKIWAQRSVSRPLAWILTSLVAVLVDPHLVDYDLTVLVPAGLLSALVAPQLRWWIVLLYPLLVLRAQVPFAGGTLQVAIPVLVWCVYVVLLTLRRGSGRASLVGSAPAPESVVTVYP